MSSARKIIGAIFREGVDFISKELWGQLLALLMKLMVAVSIRRALCKNDDRVNLVLAQEPELRSGYEWWWHQLLLGMVEELQQQ